MLEERYVNPFTDFGFKKLFGTEANKDLLIDFLNSLLQGREIIQELQYKPKEKLGFTDVDRKAVYDLYCTNEQGEQFIIELQKTPQPFFKDRALYYTTFPIQEQAKKGKWNYELKAVYLVGILDFIFDHDKADPEKYRYEVKLSDIETHEIFYDKLTFLYLEMPKFKKSEEELHTHFEKWMYVLKSLSEFSEPPTSLQESIFQDLFEVAETSKLSREEWLAYEESLKVYRDLQNSFDTAREEGRAEGLKQGIEQGEKQKAREMAKVLKQQKVDFSIIAQASGLSLEEIEKL